MYIEYILYVATIYQTQEKICNKQTNTNEQATVKTGFVRVNRKSEDQISVGSDIDALLNLSETFSNKTKKIKKSLKSVETNNSVFELKKIEKKFSDMIDDESEDSGNENYTGYEECELEFIPVDFGLDKLYTYNNNSHTDSMILEKENSELEFCTVCKSPINKNNKKNQLKSDLENVD